MSRVVVGEHNYTDPGDGQVEAAPSVWSSHPLYDKITNNYDLAIVTLASSLAFSSSGHWDNTIISLNTLASSVAPVCLPSATSSYEDIKATVTGWGTTTFGGSQPSVLHEAEVTTRL